MPTENERRFLLDRLPPNEALSETSIRQAYCLVGGGWSLRVRRESPPGGETKNSVTLKSPYRGVSRKELDVAPDDLTDEDAESLYRAMSQHSVVKTRRSYLIDDEGWDVDEFHWDNEGLFIAELEMQDAEALVARPVPTWAIREITHDSQYSNAELAYHPFKNW